MTMPELVSLDALKRWDVANAAAQRERIATAALQGLLAATPATTQATSNADAYAKRAVRYADALLDALNHATTEATHARHR